MCAPERLGVELSVATRRRGTLRGSRNCECLRTAARSYQRTETKRLRPLDEVSVMLGGPLVSCSLSPGQTWECGRSQTARLHAHSTGCRQHVCPFAARCALAAIPHLTVLTGRPLDSPISAHKVLQPTTHGGLAGRVFLPPSVLHTEAPMAERQSLAESRFDVDKVSPDDLMLHSLTSPFCICAGPASARQIRIPSFTDESPTVP